MKRFFFHNCRRNLSRSSASSFTSEWVSLLSSLESYFVNSSSRLHELCMKSAALCVNAPRTFDNTKKWIDNSTNSDSFLDCNYPGNAVNGFKGLFAFLHHAEMWLRKRATRWDGAQRALQTQHDETCADNCGEFNLDEDLTIALRVLIDTEKLIATIYDSKSSSWFTPLSQRLQAHEALIEFRYCSRS